MADYTENFTSETGDTIDASELETEFDAIATAIATKLDSDGSGSMSGNLAMGSNKVTNLASPTNANDAVNFSSLAIRQIKISTYATDTATSMTSYQDTGLEGSITLNHSDSKIIVVANAFTGAQANGLTLRYQFLEIYNNSSATQICERAVGRVLVSSSTTAGFSYSSATVIGTETPGAGTYTYKLRHKSANANSTSHIYSATGVQAVMVILECAP